MTQQDLNKFIFHYLTEDRTKSAIMLKGGWGTGKSHYILNSLIPFLEKDENGKHQCIVVSLYGMKDTLDISKAIYLECRARFLQAKSERAAAGMLVGKSIIKGVTSFFGVDLSKNDADMQTLFESIDLSGKLVVLEDLERSGISILEVLGYVNNLVEQDGVKVLLVANEDDILKTETKTRKNSKGEEESYTVYTELAYQYLCTKEKTISDTILYVEDYPAAIQSIIRSFECQVLDTFANDDDAEDIVSIMILCKSCNLRSFIFACQKAADIFNKMDSQFTKDPIICKAVFYGIVFFALRYKNGWNPHWGEEQYFSFELGNDKAPLFKFCFDYICMQELELTDVAAAFNSYKHYCGVKEAKSEITEDLSILKNYPLHTEGELKTAFDDIEKKLREKPDSIPVTDFGTVAAGAIVLKDLLNINIDSIKQLLVDNLRGRKGELGPEYIFHIMDSNRSRKELIMEYPALKMEYAALHREMVNALRGKLDFFAEFDYFPGRAHELRLIIDKERFDRNKDCQFLKILDIDRLAKMFFECNPAQKNDIRIAFMGVYGDIDVLYDVSAELEDLQNLLEILKAQASGDVGDRIQRLQYEWFIHYLEVKIKENC